MKSKKGYAYIFIFLLIIVTLIISYLVKNGETFDTQYWIEFFNKLLPGLALLFFTVVIIGIIFDKHKKQLFNKINQQILDSIEFESNRIAFRILKYLEIRELKLETFKVSILDFENYMKSGLIEDKLWEKFNLNKTSNKDLNKKIDDLLKIFNESNLTKLIEKIRPFPKLEAQQYPEKIHILKASLEALVSMNKTKMKLCKNSNKYDGFPIISKAIYGDLIYPRIKEIFSTIIKINNDAISGELNEIP